MRTLKELARPNVLKIMPYSSARDESGNIQGIFLDANENPFGENNRYPDPYQKSLKEKLSQLKKIEKEKIFIGNGSDEIIDLLYRVFCNPGKDRVLFFSPTFGMYEISALLNEVESIDIPLTCDFQLDLEKAKPHFKDPKLKIVVICSPNNPTGNNINPEDIDFILKNFDGIIAIDEAYIEFSDQASYLEKVSKYPNLVVFQTLSKAWGIAGARIGMAYADKNIIDLINKVKHPYNISSLDLDIALKTLAKLEEFEKKRKIILSEKNKLLNELEKLPIVKKVYPSATNFFLVEFTDGNWVFQTLLKEKIIVRNQDPKIKNALRITIGSAQENEKLIEVLKLIA